MHAVKVKDVLAALTGLDPELECCLELLPKEDDRARGLSGAFGAAFKVTPQAGADGQVNRVFFSQLEEAGAPWPR
ncbi:hypothetical protein DBR42_06575 [Pelomonas sp. HMWF004]|nr:hypothetical protein DBR42_06575 [Pelomonas sp. HMWF004]